MKGSTLDTNRNTDRNNPYYSKDSEWLRKARLQRGKAQHDLAADLRTNQGRLSEWERGLAPIPPDQLARLKAILN